MNCLFELRIFVVRVSQAFLRLAKFLHINHKKLYNIIFNKSVLFQSGPILKIGIST